MSTENGDTPVVETPAGTPETPAVETKVDETTTSEPVVDQKTESEAAPTVKDWAARRAEYAGDDEKLLARLSRYSSEKDVLDALVAAQKKISSGSLKTALPEKATPEQLAEWRADNGIPDTPTAYELTMPDGATDTDKAAVAEFAKTAHGLNMTPAQLNGAVAWQLAATEAAVEARAQLDRETKSAGEEELRGEWGSEFKLNRNMITGLLDSAPEGVKDQFLGGRLADGTLIGNDPKVLRWLASLAREVNPVATVVGNGPNQAQAIASEMAALEKMMGDRKSEYWKGDNALKHQERYRQLVTVQSKLMK